jgi:hypothetical protein
MHVEFSARNSTIVCYSIIIIIFTYFLNATSVNVLLYTEREERKDSSDSSDEDSSSSPTPKAGAVTSSVVSGQKRQPCVYFLSGYCRNGTACPDFHGMDPDLDDFEV